MIRMHAGWVFLAVLVFGWGQAWSSEDPGEKKEAGAGSGGSPVQELLKKLDSADAAQRAAAEEKLRKLGKEALAELGKAKLENSEAQTRLRTVLMDLTIRYAEINSTDANTLSQLSREEALEKRYANASRGYERAEKLYEKLEKDAKDRKDKDQESEFDKKKDRMGELKRKAERLAKGQDHKVSHWGPIPTVEKVTDDGDW